MDCPSCDRSFGSEAAMKIHHSKAHGESISGAEVACSTCGETFRKTPSHVEKYDRHFCSVECKSEGYKRRVTLTCDQCGDVFERRKSAAEAAERHYCSTTCKGKAYRKRVEVACGYCGEEFLRRRSRAMQYETNYCSDECRVAHQRGMAHPNWKGGDGVAVALRRHLAGKPWRRVRERLHGERNPECQTCGRTTSRNGRRLQIHHIIPVMAGGTHHDENLMFLCHRCHRTAESYTTAQLDYPITRLIRESATRM